MAVIVTGPRQTVVTRRKGRVLGVWVNQASRTFRNVPSFLDIRSNRPLDAIAPADVLRRQGIGLKNALFNAGIPSDGDDPFLINFVNTRLQEGRFNERFDGVTFLSRAAFRNEMPLPTTSRSATTRSISSCSKMAKWLGKLWRLSRLSKLASRIWWSTRPQTTA